eukprot:COSAG06_NODE_299_length_18009_cov_6.715952_7_plen_904_part_00
MNGPAVHAVTFTGTSRAGAGMAAFQRVSLAERLDAFENEVNEVDNIKRAVKVEQVSVANSGEVILAQLFHYIERTMAKIIDVFERIDADGSGALDKSEFRKAVFMMGFEVPGVVPDTLRKPEEFEVDAAFDVLDADGGGEVEIEEFLSAMKAQRKQAALEALERQQRGETFSDGERTVREKCLLTADQMNDVRRTVLLCSGSGATWLPSEKVVGSLQRWLWQVELFAFMSPEQRRRFCTGCDVQCAEAGQPVLRLGDATGGITIVLEGSCAIYLPRSQSISMLDAKAGVRQEVAQNDTAGGDLAKVVVKATQTKAQIEESRARSEQLIAASAEAAARKWQGRMTRRGAEDLSAASKATGTSQLIELTFGPGEVFGEERAFHNINSELVKTKGLLTVSATIMALESCQFIVIKQPELLVVLEKAYQDLQGYKIDFLKRIPHYKYCSESSLKLLARNLRRQVCAPREMLANEGEAADKAYFIVSGKMQVEQGGKPVAVLGPGTCFGDWGVINGEKRAASLSCVTECEVLVVHAYNFIRTVDRRVIAALKEKQALVKSGKSMASATQIVDDQVRKAVSSSMFEIIRKSAPAEPRAASDDAANDNTASSNLQPSPPASPRAPTGNQRKNRGGGTNERPVVSLDLELGGPLKNTGGGSMRPDHGSSRVAPLRMANGVITQHRAGTVSSTSSSVANSTNSDPVSASSEPDRPPYKESRSQHQSPTTRNADADAGRRKTHSTTARDSTVSSTEGSSSRSIRVAAHPYSSARSWTARGETRRDRHRSPRHRHHTELERLSPRGGKLPSLKIKVASPRNRQQQQLQHDSNHPETDIHLGNFSPRNTTGSLGFFGLANESARRRRSPTGSGSGSAGTGRTGGGGGGSAMLAREASRIRSNPRRANTFRLEIET